MVETIQNDPQINNLKGYYPLGNKNAYEKGTASKYVPASLDTETSSFLSFCRSRSYIVQFILHYLASLAKFLRLSKTTANGLIHRGEMFVFSEEQLQSLLPAEMKDADRSRTLIDIGAGDGGITSIAARTLQIPPSQVYATEASWAMEWRLGRRGYKVLRDLSNLESQNAPEQFDVVMCLNVVDRTDDPAGLLDLLHKLTKPNGVIVLAVVFPFCPGVEEGPKLRPPKTLLKGMQGACCSDKVSFDMSASRFMSKILPEAKMELVSWTKVPYICNGDLFNDWYLLPDALMVLRKTE